MPPSSSDSANAEYIKRLEAENIRLTDALAESAQRVRQLQSIFDHLPSMIGYWDRDLRNGFGNRVYFDWFGISSKQMHGRHIREVIGEERYHLNLPYINGVLRGEAQVFERAIPTPDGQQLRHSLANYIPDIQDGEVEGFFVVVSDITVVKDAQNALRLSEERYRRVVQDQTEVIYRLNEGGVITFANEVFCRFLGKTEHELIGNIWHSIVFADDIERVTEALASLSSANPVLTIENRVCSGDGHVYWMEFTNRGRFDDAGRLQEIQSVGRDISERRQAEEKREQLTRQLERLSARLTVAQEEERSRMAYQLHEELAQELATIKMYLHLTGHPSADAQMVTPTESALSMLTRATERVRELVSSLEPRELEHVGLYAAVEMHCKRLIKTAACSLNIHAPKPEKRAPRSVEMACFRILQEGLSHSLHHSKASAIWVNLSQNSEKLSLEIRDNGIGFAPDNPRGNDAHDLGNLGLFAMQLRAKQAGGSITYQSVPSEGTVVQAEFPLNGKA